MIDHYADNVNFNNYNNNINSSGANDNNSDENVIPRIQLIFLCLFVGLLCISIYYIITQRSNGLKKCQILEYFSFVLLIFILSHTLFISNWISIIKFSKEIKYADLFGNLFFILGNGLFLLLLLIIGQGYTNSTQYGTNVFQRILNYLITLSMIGLSWTIYIMFVYKEGDSDGSNSIYIYYLDTTPGYILASLYGIIIGYFIFSNHLYRRDEIDISKKKLILIFTAVFINWFLLHPIVIIVAHFIDPFIKYRVVTILNLIINSIFFILLLFLFRPNAHNNQSTGHFAHFFEDVDNIDENDQEDVDDYNVASSSNSLKNEKKPLIENNNNNTSVIEISQ